MSAAASLAFQLLLLLPAARAWIDGYGGLHHHHTGRGSFGGAGSREVCLELGSVTAAEVQEAEDTIATHVVVLYGWTRCGCMNVAWRSFRAEDVCWVERGMGALDALYVYFECLYNTGAHSWVWIGGEHVGDGFAVGRIRAAGE
eukprot:gene57586-biopygen39898